MDKWGRRPAIREIYDIDEICDIDSEKIEVKTKPPENYAKLIKIENDSFMGWLHPKMSYLKRDDIRKNKEKYNEKIDEIKKAILDYEKKQIKSISSMLTQNEKSVSTFKKFVDEKEKEYDELKAQLIEKYENKYRDDLKDYELLDDKNKEIVKLYSVLLDSFEDKYSKEEKLQILKSIGFIVASYAGRGIYKGEENE